jgi:uncharacterized protein
MRICLLSDTHSHLDPKVFKYFDGCDEIWHAGDIGNAEVSDALKKLKPLRAVYGNIDGGILRKEFPEDLIFTLEGVKVYMTHIGGKPYVYPARIKVIIETEKPKIFICGHSHILRVEYDKKFNVLYLNPGAAGVHGFHKVKTLLRFDLQAGEIKNMEAIELGPRAGLSSL